MFAVPWSIGAVVDVDGREKFDTFFREILAGKDEEHPLPKAVGAKIEVPFPDHGMVYDYCYEVGWRHLLMYHLYENL